MSKYSRRPSDLSTCLTELQKRLTALKKVVGGRKSPITFELAIDMPDDNKVHISQPCPPCRPGIDSERVLAELFVALWKALRMKSKQGLV